MAISNRFQRFSKNSQNRTAKAILFLGIACTWSLTTTYGMGMGQRISKENFHQLAIEIQCNPDCEFPEGMSATVLEIGLTGEGRFEHLDAINAKNPSATNKSMVIGFPEERFDWPRFTQGVPGSTMKFAVLNELTSSDKNHGYLSIWKTLKDSMEFVRLLPGHFSIPLGEFSFHGAPRGENGGTLLLLQGLGSDAGINIQYFIAVRLKGLERLQIVGDVSNKSEIPIADILARINDGKPAEEIIDSTLRCDLGRSPKGSNLRCTKSKTRILYSKDGPTETPLGSESFNLPLAPASGMK